MTENKLLTKLEVKRCDNQYIISFDISVPAEEMMELTTPQLKQYIINRIQELMEVE
jgi:frataxin-like iron-binding protein CyaY